MERCEADVDLADSELAQVIRGPRTDRYWAMGSTVGD